MLWGSAPKIWDAGLFPEFPGALGPQEGVWSKSCIKAGCTILRSPQLCFYAPSPNSNFLFSEPEITGLFPEFPRALGPQGCILLKFFLKWGWPPQLCFYEQVPDLTFKFWPPGPRAEPLGPPGCILWPGCIVPELTHGPNQWGSLLWKKLKFPSLGSHPDQPEFPGLFFLGPGKKSKFCSQHFVGPIL